MSYQQYKSLDKNLIFAEYFNSEQEVRRNGGAPTDCIFANGAVDVFTNSGYIDYTIPVINKELSVRIRAKDLTVGLFQYFCAFSTSEYCRIGATLVYEDKLNNATMYVDGVPSDTAANVDEVEIVFSGISALVGLNILRIGAYPTGGNQIDAKITLVEIYNKALSAEEVTNLYNNARYVLPNLEKKRQVGAEKIANGNFLNWTADNPDDWTTSNEDADNYITENSGTVRVVSDGSTNVFINQALIMTIGLPYVVSIDMVDATDGALIVDDGGGAIYITASSVGTHEAVVVATGTGIRIKKSTAGATSDFSFDNVSVKEIIVPETKTILNVNAFDGVARNKLSGDVASIAYQSDFSSSVDGWTADWGTAGAGVMSYSNDNLTLSVTAQPSSSAALRPQVTKSSIMTSGKKYRLVVKGTGMVAGYYSGGTFVNITDIDLNTAPLDITFTADGSTLILYYNGQTYPDFVISEVRLEEIIPEVTNTDIEVVKEGAVRVPRFSGIYTRIDCGNYHDLTGDITVLAWIRSNKYEGADQYIFSNGQFYVRTDNLKYLRTSSDDSITASTTSSDSLKNATWQLFAMPRRADGFVVDMYIDAVNILNSRNTGTPVAGDKIEIGRDDAGAKPWNGEISEVRIIEGLLTPSEISSYYTATKHLYNK